MVKIHRRGTPVRVLRQHAPGEGNLSVPPARAVSAQKLPRRVVRITRREAGAVLPIGALPEGVEGGDDGIEPLSICLIRPSASHW